MKKDTRMNRVLYILKTNTLAQSASKIAKELSVSRQIIVGDIALLRAQGFEIQATSKGYLLNPDTSRIKKVISSLHSVEETRLELEILVKHRVEVVDVWIDHPVYQNIQGNLNIRTREDIDQFLAKRSPLLLSLTDGVHFHTVLCEDESDFNNALAELQLNGIITKVS